MQIRLLQAVGQWAKGEVIELEDGRARRLVLTGYAQRVITEADEPELTLNVPRLVKKKAKE